MTTPKLRMIERRFARTQAPASAPSPAAAGSLGAALEQLLSAEIDRRIAEQTEKQPQAPRLRRILDDFRHPDPVPDTRGPLPNSATPAPRQIPPITFTRGVDGRPRTISIGQQQLLVQRDAHGLIVGLMPLDDAPAVEY